MGKSCEGAVCRQHQQGHGTDLYGVIDGAGAEGQASQLGDHGFIYFCQDAVM